MKGVAPLEQKRGPMLEYLPEPDAAQLATVIVAFANGTGGTVVVGMDEQGRIYSESAEHLEPIMERALQMIAPPFRSDDLPEWSAAEMPAGQVATVAVKPVSYRVAVEGLGVFVRSGTLNVRLEPGQGGRSGQRLASFEEEIVAGATLADLDDEVIADYEHRRQESGPRGEILGREELLREAGALDIAGHPTTAGILLFGKHPQQFFPQVGVVIVRYKGRSVHEAVASSETYTRRVDVLGPLARQVERTWEILHEEIQLPATVNGLQRHEALLYPPEAVREAVVNAIAHRDYTITGQRIEVRLFDDRMEIMSPGGLPGHITIDNMRDEHYSRNPRLVRSLYYWRYIEELGQGVDIIFDTMRREHHPEPVFQDTRRNLILTLYNAVDQIALRYGNALNPRQERAIRWVEAHERITNREYRELCPEVTPETLRLDLRDLVEKGVLLQVGSKRGTYYIFKAVRPTAPK